MWLLLLLPFFAAAAAAVLLKPLLPLLGVFLFSSYSVTKNLCEKKCSRYLVPVHTYRNICCSLLLLLFFAVVVVAVVVVVVVVIVVVVVGLLLFVTVRLCQRVLSFALCSII